MQKFTYRPYYAFDCDSVMGFNNGRYLDELSVEAATEAEARAAALRILADDFHMDTADTDEAQALDVDVAWTFGHNDDGDYLYKYLDLGEPEVA